MNNCVVYLLLSICIAKSLGCAPVSEHDRDAWKRDRVERHINSVDSIVNGAIFSVKRYANEKGNSIAQSCYHGAKQLLLDLASNGENEVIRCIEIADTELDGDNCCYQVLNIIGEESTKIAMAASRCISKARMPYKAVDFI